MGCNYLRMYVSTTILLLCLHHTTWAARTIEGERWLKNNTKDINNAVAMQSLQRGPVKPSQKNPCSTIPGRSKGHCTLGEMNVAGHHVIAHVVHAPPPFPDTVLNFGAAVAASNINADDDTPK